MGCVLYFIVSATNYWADRTVYVGTHKEYDEIDVVEV